MSTHKMVRKLLVSLGKTVKDHPSQFVKCNVILIHFSDSHGCLEQCAGGGKVSLQ